MTYDVYVGGSGLQLVPIHKYDYMKLYVYGMLATTGTVDLVPYLVVAREEMCMYFIGPSAYREPLELELLPLEPPLPEPELLPLEPPLPEPELPLEPPLPLPEPEDPLEPPLPEPEELEPPS